MQVGVIRVLVFLKLYHQGLYYGLDFLVVVLVCYVLDETHCFFVILSRLVEVQPLFATH